MLNPTVTGATTAGFITVIVVIVALWWVLVERPDRAADRSIGAAYNPRHAPAGQVSTPGDRKESAATAVVMALAGRAGYLLARLFRGR